MLKILVFIYKKGYKGGKFHTRVYFFVGIEKKYIKIVSLIGGITKYD